MPSDELRARRAGRREANLRELNERIAQAQHDIGAGRAIVRIVCECSNGDCDDNLDVPAPIFESARAGAVRFIVAPGHVLHEVERQVEAGEGWIIVEKVGAAARAAAKERPG